jgi:hypothetical protein
MIDKLTILGIKRERIRDAEKRANLELEFAALQSKCELGAGGASRRTARGQWPPLGDRG